MKMLNCRVAMVSLLVAVAVPCHADEAAGVVMDRTITVAGQVFFQDFVSAWRDKQGSDAYSIAVRERPSARFGTQVWVEYGQRRVFQSQLPPTRAAIRPISERAADIAYEEVVQAELQRRLVRDPDLGADEI